MMGGASGRGGGKSGYGGGEELGVKVGMDRWRRRDAPNRLSWGGSIVEGDGPEACFDDGDSTPKPAAIDRDSRFLSSGERSFAVSVISTMLFEAWWYRGGRAVGLLGIGIGTILGWGSPDMGSNPSSFARGVWMGLRSGAFDEK